MALYVAHSVTDRAGLSSGGPLDARLRITLNFHPDRLTDGRRILERLADDGAYLSQFVTEPATEG